MTVAPTTPTGDAVVPHRFVHAFEGGDALSERARELLVTKLDVRSGHADDRLSEAELGDLTDPKRRYELRSWFEGALTLGWDRAALRSRRLGDLAPSARMVADGRIGPGSLDQRARSLLERAGYTRWSELLEVTVGQLLAGPNLGPTTLVTVLGACFERALIGLGLAVDEYDGSPLAVLLAEERRRPDQRVLEALLESAASRASSAAGPAVQGIQSRIAGASRSILVSAAPWALESASALVELMSGITDDQDRLIFARTELVAGRRASLAEVAAELDISSTRVAQRRDRAAAQLRDELAAAPAPLGWLVEHVRRTLGAVTTQDAAMIEVGVHGFDSAAPHHDAPEVTRLLLWLAGPFEPVAHCPGWLGVRPDELVARTREMLAEDGGVVSLLTVAHALLDLGVTDQTVEPWLEACGGVVVDGDLTVWLSGPLPDVLERLIDAHSRSMTADECCDLLRRGGRTLTQPEIERALQGRRFRRLAGEAFELACWPSGTASTVAQHSRKRNNDARFGRERPAFPAGSPSPKAHTETSAPATDSAPGPDLNRQLGLPGIVKLAPERSDSALWGSEAVGDATTCAVPGRAWMTVTVDAEVLRGEESPVSDGLVCALGLGLQQRRTFSSRFGPVMLANDGAEPSRGPLRPVAMGTGAGLGDVLVLGFAPEGDVVVEVRRAPRPDVSSPVLGPPELAECGPLPDHMVDNTGGEAE